MMSHSTILPKGSYKQKSLVGYSPWVQESANDWATNTDTKTDINHENNSAYYLEFLRPCFHILGYL